MHARKAFEQALKISKQAKEKVFGRVTIYRGKEFTYLKGSKVRIVAVLKNAVHGDDYTTVSDEESLARLGGVTALDRIEVQPWIEKAGRFSFVTSDPKAIDLACFHNIKSK